jgi:hypothetical protein
MKGLRIERLGPRQRPLPTACRGRLFEGRQSRICPIRLRSGLKATLRKVGRFWGWKISGLCLALILGSV